LQLYPLHSAVFAEIPMIFDTRRFDMSAPLLSNTHYCFQTSTGPGPMAHRGQTHFPPRRKRIEHLGILTPPLPRPRSRKPYHQCTIAVFAPEQGDYLGGLVSGYPPRECFGLTIASAHGDRSGMTFAVSDQGFRIGLFSLRSCRLADMAQYPLR